MKPLPPPEKLAALVSNVTQTMFGISFEPDSRTVPWPEMTWRTAVLPILGEHPVTVGLSSDADGCYSLGATMFGVGKDSVDSSMINDSLGELLNMTAGLVRTALALDQALGLPKILGGEAGRPAVPEGDHAVVLKAKSMGLVLWICEGLL